MAQLSKTLSEEVMKSIADLFHTDHMPAQFLVATFISPDNEIIATYHLSGLDEDTIAAPLATTSRIFSNPESQTALYQMQESVFYDLDGRRLVCHPITFAENPYLLIVLTKAQATYRRDLNQFCKKIIELDTTQ